MRILFLTIEFRTGTFSGNGVYATAQIRALTAAGHQVIVLAARPRQAEGSEERYGTEAVFEVPVDTWYRLDAGTPWREYAAGLLDERITAAVRAFAPEAVLGVDWSALPAVRNILPYTAPREGAPPAPYVYLNYRVFSRTATGEDLELVSRLEAEAMAESVLTVALSRSDQRYLVDVVAAGGGAAAAAAAAVEPKVLLPALREDVRQLDPPADLLTPEEARADAAGHRMCHLAEGAVRAEAEAGVEAGAGTGPPGVGGPEERTGACSGSGAGEGGGAQAGAARSYLACVVRLSPEKEPERFVALVEALAAAGLLQRHGLTPLLLGAADDEFAQGIKARLRAAAPSAVVLEQFVGPAELAALYRRTALNVHPSTYDAYGMTIVEAASQGAPSIVHDGNGAVGATDLLSGEQGEVLLLDLTQPPQQLAEAVGQLLQQPQKLRETAARALHKARSWDEAANAAELVRMVTAAMRAGRG